MSNIVLFNGPPGTGKDEACQFLETNHGFKHLFIKDALFDETAKFFNVSREWFLNGYDDRLIKETKQEEKLNNLTRRQALIFVSEEIIKPKYGLDIFGTKLAEKINLVSSYCVSDCGFKEEIQAVINNTGAKRVCIVQLYREGCTYDTDSRFYVNGILNDEFILGTRKPEPVSDIVDIPIRMYRIFTNSSLSDFHKTIRTIIRKEANVHKEISVSRKSV